MAEQRLIDANNLGVGKASSISEQTTFAYGWNSALQAVKESSPTIDPETLPIVQQLRAEVANLKDQLSHLEYWQLNREVVLESAAQDRAAMNVMRKRCEKTIAELREELKQVKAERDAAVSDLEEVMAYGSRSKDTCQYCGSESCYARNGGKPCYPKWRGPQKEATNDQS